MKRLKFVMLVAIMNSLLLDIEATAEITTNQQEKIEPSSGQNRFFKGEKGLHSVKIVNVDASGIHGLEAKTEDEPNSMTWDAAIMVVREYGQGWRLPTIAELKMMYEKRKFIGGFSAEDYWSSTERDVNSAWIQGFRLGDQDRYNKQSKLKVRAVRPF